MPLAKLGVQSLQTQPAEMINGLMPDAIDLPLSVWLFCRYYARNKRQMRAYKSAT
ncbi:hypothetical protein SPV1_11906 [Mariprofundus ferrooxydans PV-1]|uniref:Uncharacterized protein n=1 Tax=Mariprofundus ferrooxydans PV-1 TaxID=314345 RepID=Q0F0V5_9PROT|nr:hypothetical protein SPV1_11906 [Mariprofundus ferrooxydans PV-1]